MYLDSIEYDADSVNYDYEIRPFKVEWHTEPAPGCAYYSGSLMVRADSKEQASGRAVRRLIREMFPEQIGSSIIVTHVRDMLRE